MEPEAEGSTIQTFWVMVHLGTHYTVKKCSLLNNSACWTVKENMGDLFYFLLLILVVEGDKCKIFTKQTDCKTTLILIHQNFNISWYKFGWTWSSTIGVKLLKSWQSAFHCLIRTFLFHAWRNSMTFLLNSVTSVCSSLSSS